MKTSALLTCLFVVVTAVGCGGSTTPSIVVDKNEADKYNVPEDVIEQEMAAAQTGARQ
ncbi:MAG: hypothetical protein AAGD07_04175 [Planctomycetota bacterium]